MGREQRWTIPAEWPGVDQDYGSILKRAWPDKDWTMICIFRARPLPETSDLNFERCQAFESVHNEHTASAALGAQVCEAQYY